MRKCTADGKCTVDGCGRVYLAKGFCRKHYKHWKLYGDPLLGPTLDRTPAERMAALTNRDGPIRPGMTQCWLSTASPASPRGFFKLDGEQMIAARAAWVIENGPIPDGLYVCHHCDTPRCVRVSHLFLGTAADNTADMIAKARNANQRKTHCPAAHEYTAANTYVAPSGARSCRKCRALYQATLRAARRTAA